MKLRDILLAVSVGIALALQNIFAREMAVYNRDIPTVLYIRYFLMFLLVFVIFYLYSQENHPTKIFTKMDKKEWVYTVLLVVCTIWALGMTYYLLTKYPSHEVVPFIAIYPIWIVLITYLFLADKITPQSVVGIGIIVGGLYLITSEKKLK